MTASQGRTGTGEALYRFAVRGVVNAIFPGAALVAIGVEEIALPFSRSAWAWLSGRAEPEREHALRDLARIPFQRAREIVQDLLRGREGSEEAMHSVRGLLSAVPMRAQRTLSALEAGAGGASAATTLLTRVPDPEAALARLVPLRPPLFEPGHQLDRHDYELDTLLGQGGLGEVWRAHGTLRRSRPPVAIKFCLDAALEPLLEREIRLLDQLEGAPADAGIVELLDSGSRARPPFLVYEYVEGGDLADWLASYEGRPPPLESVVVVLRKIARALAFAHRRGVVHRDLKPSNVLVGRDSRVKLTDFGIGMLAEDEASGHGAAGTSIHQGLSLVRAAATPLYRDPYLARGDPPDPRHDVYPFGILAVQLLVGDVREPVAPGWRVHVDQVRGAPAPPALLDLIDRCLVPPQARLAHGAELLAALDEVATALGVAGRETPDTAPAASARSPEPASPVAVPAPDTTLDQSAAVGPDRADAAPAAPDGAAVPRGGRAGMALLWAAASAAVVFASAAVGNDLDRWEGAAIGALLALGVSLAIALVALTRARVSRTARAIYVLGCLANAWLAVLALDEIGPAGLAFWLPPALVVLERTRRARRRAQATAPAAPEPATGSETAPDRPAAARRPGRLARFLASPRWARPGWVLVWIAASLAATMSSAALAEWSNLGGFVGFSDAAAGMLLGLGISLGVGTTAAERHYAAIARLAKIAYALGLGAAASIALTIVADVRESLPALLLWVGATAVTAVCLRRAGRPRAGAQPTR